MSRAADLLEEDGYEPIADYAVIGNCRTVALVSRRGSIDWLCLPEFSSPSVFAALLDARRGGRFVVRPRDVVEIRREYVGDTNVLQTTFRCRGGELRLTDAMTVLDEPAATGELHPQHEVLRLAECVAGEVAVDVLFQMRPDYGRCAPRLRERGRLGWLCTAAGVTAYLYGDLRLAPAEGDGGALAGTAVLGSGQSCRLVFSYSQHEMAVLAPMDDMRERLQRTQRWWQAWASRCTYAGRHRPIVIRSCLTLKLLSYHLSGAVVAAATTSLPEGDTGERNWDYRYCWLRDASMLLQSFAEHGFSDESDAFLDWLLHATQTTRPHLRVLYSVHGQVAADEREVPGLAGYAGLGPVRVGNSASGQVQHDVYGQVLLTALRFVENGGVLDGADRRLLVALARTAAHVWRQPDHGIWEIRLPPRHNTHSKLMCWVALDALIALQRRIGLGIDEQAQVAERERIREDIERHGFNREVNSYVGYYGGTDPDASLLLMPRYGYVAADDERMIGTWRHIESTLGERGLIYRYPPGGAYDGVEGRENLFAICNFWLVDYLARLGELERADALFEQLCALGNDVGLYAEEFEVGSRRPIGNFPQAFSHEGLMTAALTLERARHGDRRRGGVQP